MRINVTIVLDEAQLRRVRAAHGRGGKATRAECRTWFQRVVLDAIAGAPEPKVRRKRETPAPPAAALGSDRKPALPGVEPTEVTDETRCRHCKRRRENHGRMMGTCPPGFGAKVGSFFEPVTS